jgi:hypothetical protein
MRNLALPNGSDVAKIDDLNRNFEILDSITADEAEDLVDNGYFPKAFNQRAKVSTTAWQYNLDRWIGRSTGIGLAIDINGLHITGDLTANVYLYQKIRRASVDMLGRTYTLVICDGDGNIGCETITLPTTEPSSWKTFVSVYVGQAYASIIHTGSGTHGFCVTVGRKRQIHRTRRLGKSHSTFRERCRGIGVFETFLDGHRNNLRRVGYRKRSPVQIVVADLRRLAVRTIVDCRPFRRTRNRHLARIGKYAAVRRRYHRNQSRNVGRIIVI